MKYLIIATTTHELNRKMCKASYLLLILLDYIHFYRRCTICTRCVHVQVIGDNYPYIDRTIIDRKYLYKIKLITLQTDDRVKTLFYRKHVKLKRNSCGGGGALFVLLNMKQTHEVAQKPKCTVEETILYIPFIKLLCT